MAELLLVTRQGCCLCEGLEEKLRQLGVPLACVDVDQDLQLLARYDLEVPVLLLRDAGGDQRELPRVSPRLAGPQLAAWLRGQGCLV
ncbi:MAG: glutaredoxin family protein [Cyanobacteria bacterium K_DeepCast_0m_m1_088]|nr:glutaredoxin family protein [Cyanobacteria bacterium K_DeepCast_0m_m1_088]